MAAGPTTAEKRGASTPKESSEGSSGAGARNRTFRAPGTRALLLALAVLLLGAGGFWALYGSSWFRVEQVRTSGTAVLTPREIEAVAAVPMGAPLVGVDTEVIEARLRERFPRIGSVEVVRSWPHGIGLKVTERKPVLLMEKGGKFIEVDTAGVRFATVDTAPGASPGSSSTARPPRACAASARTGCSGRRSASGVNSRRKSPGTLVSCASPRTTPSLWS